MCSPFTVVTDIPTVCTVYTPNTPVGLKAAPGSWDRWPVLASLPLLRAAEADQESERAQRQVASARQGVCCAVLVLSACVAMSMYIGISVVKMFGSNHPESDNTVTPLFSLSFNHSHRVLFVHTYVHTYVRMRVSVFNLRMYQRGGECEVIASCILYVSLCGCALLSLPLCSSGVHAEGTG